jgi:hypothetical protein
MIGYFKRLAIRSIASPYGLAMLSYCLFLFAWLFPPGLYTEYVREPDLMFLNPITLAFYSVCVAAFSLGVHFSRFFRSPAGKSTATHVSAGHPALYLVGPLFLAACFCSMYLILLGGKLNFVALLASQHGDAIKTANEMGKESQGRWDESLPLLTAVLWWSLFRARQLRLRGTTKKLFYLIFFPSMGVGILTCVATVDRTSLMPIIIGCLVISLFYKSRGVNVRLGNLVVTGLASMTAVLGLFLIFSFLRGALAIHVLMTSLLGYTIVSYNRLTGLLIGVMHYAYEGRGVYLSRYVLEDVKLNSVFHLIDRFGWPNGFTLWQSEFLSTSASGLNSTFIWSGAFGYVYSDIGWWTPLFVCFVGVLAGYLWARFTAGKTVGVVLYPCVGFWILTWFATNSIFGVNFIRYIEFAVALTFYDWVFLRKQYETAGNMQIPEPRLTLLPDRGIF